jgi:hypothetical protein
MPSEADVSAFKTSIKTSGNFFQGDPAEKFQKNVRTLMEAIAEAGEADVVGQLRVGQGSRQALRGVTPNRVAGHVVGRVRSLAGRQWKATAVVSLNTQGQSRAMAIRIMAAGSDLERQTGAFKRTRGRLIRARRANVDMLKGLR